MARKTWARIAAERKELLVQIVDACCDMGDFELEAGCNGEGLLVEACRLLRKPLPEPLREWLKDGHP